MELRSSLKKEEAYAHAYPSVEVTSLWLRVRCVRWKLGANKPKRGAGGGAGGATDPGPETQWQ